ncbi:PA-phosphatase [Mycolicibacterium sediminis]|uniref:Phosphoesterase n=1 Tax=Mycolicibacterium sediminis TaxID=1286180 RepID=A0A7I7QNM2_9MYCO|nr:PA-phosphatase [Mycolicibacterium sediminis]BBY27875.1 phosphoesterase [Mycolicibacterium sediminis]
MTPTPLRWWPVVGLSAMVLLGVAVGKRSTALDDVFIRAGEAHPRLGLLLFFTTPTVLAVLLAAALGVAVWRRRWCLVVVTLVTPVVALAVMRVLKHVFGRTKGDPGSLAYPSGHMTMTVAVLGVGVLVVGASAGALVVATTWTVLAMLGQSFTYHYFTDTVGAVLLSTSLVCLAALAAGLDRCQPACDVHHTSG